MDKMYFKIVFWILIDVDVLDIFIKVYVCCNEFIFDRFRVFFCRFFEGSVVRGFVRGFLVWSIMGCF